MVLHALSRVNDWVIAEDMSLRRLPFGSWSIDEQVRAQGWVISANRRRAGQRPDALRLGDVSRTSSAISHALVGGGSFIGMYHCFARHEMPTPRRIGG